MKKFILITSLTIAVSMGTFAQDSNINHRTDTSGTTDQLKDYYTMQAGKVVLMQNGASMPLITSFKLKNGSILQTDGIVLAKDGQQHKLKEGERLYLTGKISPVMKNDLVNKKDSTL